MKLIARFATDAGYREGWLAGAPAGAAYPGYRVGQEDGKTWPRPHNVANEVTNGMDTDALKSLEK